MARKRRSSRPFPCAPCFQRHVDARHDPQDSRFSTNFQGVQAGRGPCDLLPASLARHLKCRGRSGPFHSGEHSRRGGDDP
jgi:hypothetical protein